MLVLVLVLVLDQHNHEADRSKTAAMFDHEKLDAYRLAIDFIAWGGAILDEKPRRGRPSVLRHLEDSSTSIALNIAEGNGKRSMADRARYLEIARGSALECAACLDVLVVRKSLAVNVADLGKATLVRIVSMLTKLIEKLLRQPSTSTSTSTTGTTG